MIEDVLDTMSQTKLLQLQEAAALLSPEGYVKVQMLRTDIARNKLPAVRMGKNLLVTPAGLKEYRERCRVQPKAPISPSKPAMQAKTDVSYPKAHGLSGTAPVNVALAAAMKLADKLSKG